MLHLPDTVRWILRQLNQKGFAAYAVGGCVRDTLLGLAPQDWDMATNATPKEICACFPNQSFIDKGIQHGTVGLILKNTVYEITTFRVDGTYRDNRRPESVRFTEDLTEDLSRRDFTVNAMAYHDDTGIIDPFGGMADLNRKAIRCVGNPEIRFQEDALRMLRALRFSSVYDFSIEIHTAQAILNNCRLLNSISAERLASELNKLLCGNTATYILNRFRQVFAVFLPEIEVMFRFEQNTPHHNKTLWKHTMSAVKHTEPELLLRMTLLLHDIGKPLAQKKDPVKNVCHYKGHNRFSAAIAEVILKRLKYPNQFIEDVVLLINYHDVRFSDNKKQIKHVLAAIGSEHFAKLLKVQKADILAQSMYKREEKLRKLHDAETVFQEILNQNECFSLQTLAVNGRDLLHLGITKGEDIGKTLKLLLSFVIDEKLENRKDMLLQKAKELNHI